MREQLHFGIFWHEYFRFDATVMKVKPFKAAYPKVELITSPKSFFSNIKHQYIEYRDNGFYEQLDKEGYYVYQVKLADSSHIGIITLSDVTGLKKKRILKHEKTLAAKEQNMMHLLLQRKALVKPVLLGFRSNKTINQILQKTVSKKPLVKIDFKEDSEQHLIWQVSDKKLVDQITEHFKKIKKSYIGDGHHRSTTVRLLSESKKLGEEARKYDNLLTAYFPFDQLKIWDYNRVMNITGIISIPELIVELSQYFEITKLEKATKPKKKHQLTFYIDGIWYKMNWKEKFLAKKKDGLLLDSALLNKYIFGKILGVEDVRTDTRIQYYGGTQPLTKIENSANKKDQGLGVCIYPVSVKELTTMADQGQTLPPKSTWFLPRLKSGIVTKNL